MGRKATLPAIYLPAAIVSAASVAATVVRRGEPGGAVALTTTVCLVLILVYFLLAVVALVQSYVRAAPAERASSGLNVLVIVPRAGACAHGPDRGVPRRAWRGVPRIGLLRPHLGADPLRDGAGHHPACQEFAGISRARVAASASHARACAHSSSRSRSCISSSTMADSSWRWAPTARAATAIDGLPPGSSVSDTPWKSTGCWWPGDPVMSHSIDADAPVSTLAQNAPPLVARRVEATR